MKHDRLCPLMAKDWRPSRANVCQCALILETRKAISSDLKTISQAFEQWAAANFEEGKPSNDYIELEIKSRTMLQASKVALGNFRRAGFPNGKA